MTYIAITNACLREGKLGSVPYRISGKNYPTISEGTIILPDIENAWIRKLEQNWAIIDIRFPGKSTNERFLIGDDVTDGKFVPAIFKLPQSHVRHVSLSGVTVKGVWDVLNPFNDLLANDRTLVLKRFGTYWGMQVPTILQGDQLIVAAWQLTSPEIDIIVACKRVRKLDLGGCTLEGDFIEVQKAEALLDIYGKGILTVEGYPPFKLDEWYLLRQGK